MKSLRSFHAEVRSQMKTSTYGRYGVFLVWRKKMLILVEKRSKSVTNFQDGFVCLWVVLMLKMAYRASEEVLEGVLKCKLSHLP